jgi:hypothetical protein
MAEKVKLNIRYLTDPSMREKEPAKAVAVLYGIVEGLDDEIQDLKKRLKALEKAKAK